MVRTNKRAFANFIKSHSDLFTFVKAGDIVQGEVIDKSPREIVVDLGRNGTGVIYRGELMHAREAAKNAKVGETIRAKVIEVDNDEGVIELSLSEARRQESWLELEERCGKEEVFSVKPVSANKGGLVADICGIKAFLPASQLSEINYPQVENSDKNKIQEKLNELIGKEIKVKIIDCNPRTEKLIISERAASEKSAKELSGQYKIGQSIEGIVSGVADFGVFVKFADNPEIEGLIHVSELAHREVANPKEFVNLNDTIRAKITDIKDGKISLSLKALQENPWERVESIYSTGDEVKGEVYEINPFGAIVNLDKIYQGQVHVTDFGSVEEMKKHLKRGQIYTFKIKDIRPQDERITLSLISEQ